MSLITLDLPEQTKRDLQSLSSRSGKDVAAIVAELVDDALSSDGLDAFTHSNDVDDEHERAEAAAGIQSGLDDYAAGRVRSFSEFAVELRTKHLQNPKSE